MRSSPLVRKIARENNLDLRQVPGTGSAGRITKEDILGYLAKGGAPAPAPKAPAAPTPAAAPTPELLQRPLRQNQQPLRSRLSPCPETNSSR